MKCKLGKYLHIHLLILIVIHIAIPIVYLFVTSLAYTISSIPFGMSNISLEILDKNLFYGILVVFSWLMCGITICASRCLILPLLFYHLEHSECIPVKSYIKLLKTNRIARIILLITLELIFVFLFIPFKFTGWYRLIPLLDMLVAFLTIDLVGCYVALFIWWKIRGELK